MHYLISLLSLLNGIALRGQDSHVLYIANEPYMSKYSGIRDGHTMAPLMYSNSRWPIERCLRGLMVYFFLECRSYEFLSTYPEILNHLSARMPAQISRDDHHLLQGI